jgi:hypothetical protein
MFRQALAVPASTPVGARAFAVSWPDYGATGFMVIARGRGNFGQCAYRRGRFDRCTPAVLLMRRANRRHHVE